MSRVEIINLLTDQINNAERDRKPFFCILEDTVLKDTLPGSFPSKIIASWKPGNAASLRNALQQVWDIGIKKWIFDGQHRLRPETQKNRRPIPHPRTVFSPADRSAFGLRYSFLGRELIEQVLQFCTVAGYNPNDISTTEPIGECSSQAVVMSQMYIIPTIGPLVCCSVYCNDPNL